jgi:pantoate--beta-alanine ligase
MEILRNVLELITYQRDIKDLGFVPTMGNLHQGHISLVREALKEHQVCIVSIFVNPLQFGPNEDFDKYPRTLEEDVQALEDLAKEFPYGEIAVFAPENMNVIFPQGYATTIRNRVLEKMLCGKSRPHHFEGVLTVVHRLFKIIKPQTAYLGLKDYQQFKLIQAMCRDLEIDIELVGCPIIRNKRGLALSSRNGYLSSGDKINALKLSESIQSVLDLTAGKNWEECKKEVKSQIKKLLINKEIKWDYLEIRNKETLDEPSDEIDKFVILGALYMGKTRLIDNVFTPDKGNYVRSRPAPQF